MARTTAAEAFFDEAIKETLEHARSIAAQIRALGHIPTLRINLTDSVSLGFVATPAQLADVIAREGLDLSLRPVFGRLLLTYRNVSDVVTQGLEFDAQSAVTAALSVGGAYTYLSARDADNDRALTGRNPHQGHVRVSWQPAVTGFRASLRGTFFSSWIAARASTSSGVQDTIAPRFALWDAFLSQRIARGLTASSRSTTSRTARSRTRA